MLVVKKDIRVSFFLNIQTNDLIWTQRNVMQYWCNHCPSHIHSAYKSLLGTSRLQDFAGQDNPLGCANFVSTGFPKDARAQQWDIILTTVWHPSITLGANSSRLQLERVNYCNRKAKPLTRQVVLDATVLWHSIHSWIGKRNITSICKKIW